MRPGEAVLAAAALLVAAPAPARAPATNWRTIISTHDRQRLKDWRGSWITALDQARAAGAGAAIAREGVLLQPDAALERPVAPDGAYRCRLLKLGAVLPGTPPAGAHVFSAGAIQHCRIANGLLTTLDGDQRPGGRLFAFDDARLLFLGGLALGDEVGMVRYGRDPQRDLVGLLERIGPARWRLVLPQPAWEARLDVLELMPDAG